jgi:hypothetical protein
LQLDTNGFVADKLRTALNLLTPMKIKRKAILQRSALAALGVFLGRGAQADTIIDFDFTSPPGNNNPINHPFGDYASSSSDGVTVAGFGTPNIGVSWEATGDPATRWEYYNDSVWSAGQLNHSIVGTANDVVFSPNNASARVVIKSFNFFPYYDSDERFTYDVSVLSGTNVVSGPIHLTFRSDATKNHAVNINYTGAAGQTLKLRMARVASVLGAGEEEGVAGNIAADDITFAQLPTSSLAAGPQVVSVTPADDAIGIAGNSYSYLASITNGDSTTPLSGSIQLRLDGTLVTPPAVVASSGDLTNVSHTATSLLPSGSTHVYKLTYSDNLGATYTNETVFTVAAYPTLPAAYSSPAGSGSHPGFTWRSVVARQDTPDLDSTVARAIAQLNGTLIDPATSTPYTNAVAPGTNTDGSFDIPEVVNFDDDFSSAGHFFNDQPFPGLDQGGPYNWFACEGLLHLDLAPGYYRFGVNSDDGFELNVTAPAGTSGNPITLGLFDNGRSAGDTFMDFLVQTPGVYNFQLIYFESSGQASCELYSADTSTGDMTLINDTNTVGAIKSFIVIPPRITSITRSGTDVVVSWAYGYPPFQLQFKNSINGAWNNFGSPTNARTAHVPIQPGAGFIRVVGSP